MVVRCEMTQRILAQLVHVRRELAQLNERKKQMAHRATALSYVIGGIAGNGIRDKAGGYANELGYLDTMIDNAIARCVEMYREAALFIDSIADSEIRQILRYRYLDGMSWQKVAFAIGEHDEQYPRRRHNAYLKKRGVA
jgi:hypothetical protein